MAFRVEHYRNMDRNMANYHNSFSYSTPPPNLEFPRNETVSESSSCCLISLVKACFAKSNVGKKESINFKASINSPDSETM